MCDAASGDLLEVTVDVSDIFTMGASPRGSFVVSSRGHHPGIGCGAALLLSQPHQDVLTARSGVPVHGLRADLGLWGAGPSMAQAQRS